MAPRPPHGRRLGRVVGLAFAVSVSAACGNGGDTEIATTHTTSTRAAKANPAFLAADVQVRAEDIDFPQNTFRAKAGELTIGYVNEGRIFHTLVLEASDDGAVEGWGRLEVTEHGDVAVRTVALEPGEYGMYCDVPGHRAAGMEATLKVEE